MPIMYGPGISNPEKIVERDIPQADVQAYVNIGYKLGKLPKTEEIKPVKIFAGKDKAKGKK